MKARRHVARSPMLLLALSAVAGLGLAMAGNPERLLTHFYAPAFQTVETLWDRQERPARLWLSSSASSGNGQLATGDLVTLLPEAGHPEAIRVLSVERIDGGEISSPGSSVQIVTGRIGSGPASRTVRMMLVVDPPATSDPKRPDPDKTL